LQLNDIVLSYQVKVEGRRLWHKTKGIQL